MKTVDKPCRVEIVEKKSKFICNLYHVEDKEEAENLINSVKKQFYDARHNCYAYIIYDMETGSLITKASDDGEPSGTAGSPILTALKSHNIVNTLAVVTRYFGGILLGTGGLVRAYKQSTIEAIDNANLYDIEKGYLVKIEIEYADNEKFSFFCQKNNINIIKKEYMNNIKCILELNEENKKKLEEMLRYNNTKFDIICDKMIKNA